MRCQQVHVELVKLIKSSFRAFGDLQCFPPTSNEKFEARGEKIPATRLISCGRHASHS